MRVPGRCAVHAYPLGKSQEVTKILTDNGVPVLQHAVVYEVSRIYEECGVDLGDFALYEGQPLNGHAVITLPRSAREFRLPRLGETVSIAVTGWAKDEATKIFDYQFAKRMTDAAAVKQILDKATQAAKSLGVS